MGNLSPHFSDYEFKCQCGCGNKTVSKDLIDKLEQLYSKLNCSKIIVSSGFRCSKHDKEVGGNGAGMHTKGLAADICCYGQDGKPINTKLVCCAAQDLGFGGIANINESYTYTHVDVRTGSRWLGNEVYGTGTVTTDFYEYFGISKNESHSIKVIVDGKTVYELVI